MKRLLRFCSILLVVGVGTIDSVYATISCELAEQMLEKCDLPHGVGANGLRGCETCCGMNFGYLESDEIADCERICTAGTTGDCDDGGSGGGGSGDTCPHGSCSDSTNCSGTYSLCNQGCCDEPRHLVIKTPICNGSNLCTCKLIGGGAGDNYETWLLNNCAADSGSGNGQNSSLGFPQTDCATKQAISSQVAVLEYGNTDSYYSACDGYIQQSQAVLDRMSTCTQCNPGYTRVAYSDVMNMTYGTDYTSSDYNNWPCNSPGDTFAEASSIYVCVQCVAKYTGWAAYGTGYERRQEYYDSNCDTSTSYQYQCAAGYYGTTTDGVTGCTRCPLICNSTDLRGTSPAGSTDVSDCCAAAGATGNDNKGHFSLRAKYCGA